MYTNRHQDAHHLLAVRSSIRKGLGVFAKASTSRSTRVISESALLKLSREDFEHLDAEEIVRAFETLSSSQQDQYLMLRGYASEGFRRVVELQLGEHWDGIPGLHRKMLEIFASNDFSDVFILGSRIHNSCIPNVHFVYNTIFE